MKVDRRSFTLGWQHARREMKIELAKAVADIEAEMASLRAEFRMLRAEQARAAAIDAAIETLDAGGDVGEMVLH